MAKPKVIVDPGFRTMDQLFSRKEFSRLKSIAKVVWARDREMPEAEIARHRKDAAAIVCGWYRYGAVTDWPNLKAVIEVGGGLPDPKTIDYRECFSRGIRVMSCAPGFGPAVAEMALALTLSCSRTTVETDRRFREGTEKWEFGETADSFSLFDRTVGFIGFGSLARNLKPLLAPFRCRILASDPWLPETYLRDQGVEPCGLDELLSSSSVIYVLAIPSPENRGLLDRKKLSRIRPGSVLVLISRSHLVDFDALTDLVARGRFRAAIDVFPNEPLAHDHPIRRVPGVVLSSHKAGAMAEAMRLIGTWTVNDLEAVLSGREPKYLQSAQPEFVKHYTP